MTRNTPRIAIKVGDLVRYQGSQVIHQIVDIWPNGYVRVISPRGAFKTITRPEHLEHLERVEEEQCGTA